MPKVPVISNHNKWMNCDFTGLQNIQSHVGGRMKRDVLGT